MCQLAGYNLRFVWALMSLKAVPAARLLAPESQLAICKDRIQQKKNPRPRFTAAFRAQWVVLSKFLDAWEDRARPKPPAW